MSYNHRPFHCSECYGLVIMIAKEGRTRIVRVDGKLIEKPVPSDFALPECQKCGEEYSVPEVMEQLDKLLCLP